MSFLNKLDTATRSFFASILESQLPNRTKRLVFLASLTARLKATDKVDNEIFRKLNLAMELSKTDSALKSPYYLSRAIWHGKASYEILGRDQTVQTPEQTCIKELASKIISAMPTWLWYGERSEIAKDVEHLLDNKSLGFSF